MNALLRFWFSINCFLAFSTENPLSLANPSLKYYYIAN